MEEEVPANVTVLPESIPETFKLPKKLIKVFTYAGVNLPADQQANVYKLFYSLSVSSIITGFHLKSLKNKVTDPVTLSCVDNADMLTILIAIGYFLTGKDSTFKPIKAEVQAQVAQHVASLNEIQNDTDNDSDDEDELISNGNIDSSTDKLAAMAVHTGVSHYTTNWKTMKLDDFSGFPGDWFQWRISAVATFCQCGLFEVLDNKAFASQHIPMNAAVHGMLTHCFAQTEKCCMLHTTHTMVGNGYGAWQNLLAFYENHSMINSYIQYYYDEFEKLEVTEHKEFYPFSTEFLFLQGQLDMLQKLSADKATDPSEKTRSVPIESYPKEFLKKMNIGELQTITEVLQREAPKAIPAYIQLFTTALTEKKLLVMTSKKKRNNSDHKDKQGSSNNKPAASPSISPPGNHSDVNAHYKKKLISEKEKTSDPSQKKYVQSLIDKCSPPAPNKGARFQTKHGKGNGKKHSRRVASTNRGTAAKVAPGDNIDKMEY
jgi:hypothetical protein